MGRPRVRFSVLTGPVHLFHSWALKEGETVITLFAYYIGRCFSICKQIMKSLSNLPREQSSLLAPFRTYEKISTVVEIFSYVRKGGDSNSRGAFTPDSFQDCSFQPLRHPSAYNITLFLAFFQVLLN